MPINNPSLSSEARVWDTAEDWSQFSQPADTHAALWDSSVRIEGMVCAACAANVETALLAVPGVLGAQVSSASARARVRWRAAQVRPSEWMEALRAHGYRAVPALDASVQEARRREARLALWRWLVATLCMMQVMMYAFPTYGADPGTLDPDTESLLRWASWVLSLPVLVFSCAPLWRSAARDLLHARIGMDLPVALGLLITFVVSTVATFDRNGPLGAEVYFDSFTMFVFFLLSARWLEARLRARTAGALDALHERLPQTVARQLQGEGGFETVALHRLAPGDVLRVGPGEAFCADGVLVLGETQVDEALLTGESLPLVRRPGDRVLAGSHNLGASVLQRVDGLGAQTRFAHIVALMESAATSRPQAVALADRIARPFLVVVLVAAALAALWGWERDPARALLVAAAVLIVTCPCALSLATPTALLAGAAALAQRGVLVRDLGALERLAQVDTVVFDKTGTLTADLPTLAAQHTRDDVPPGLALAWAAALARHSLHPLARALVAAHDAAPAAPSPWSADSVTESAGQGLAGVVHGVGGAPRALRLGSAAFCAIAPTESAQTQVHLCDASGWVASFALAEHLRPGADVAVAQLQARGVRCQLLSGDASVPVQRVAQALNIPAARAQCTPQDKLDHLRSLQAAQAQVLMVGDGVNDAPVLAAAQVSMAMGQGAGLARARADLVLVAADLSVIPLALQLARKTMTIVRQNLAWALVYNAVCVPLAVLGYLPAWAAGLGMATSSLVVVINALRVVPKRH